MFRDILISVHISNKCVIFFDRRYFLFIVQKNNREIMGTISTKFYRVVLWSESIL